MRIAGRRVIAWALLLVMGLMIPLSTGAEEQTFLSEPISLEDLLVEKVEEQTPPPAQSETPQETQEPAEGFVTLQETYLVTFLIEGETYLTQEVDRDTLASPPPEPADPAGEGRHFIGWYEPDAQTPFDFYTLINRNLTLETRFSDRFLVIFRDSDLGKREILRVETITDGESVSATELAVECPVGRRFSHWYVEGTENPGLHPYHFSTPVHENLTLLPYLSDICMAVFVAEGMDTLTQRLEPGEQARAIEPPVLPGHAFLYWATEDGTPYDFSLPVHGLVTLHAQWEAKPTAFQLVYWVEEPGLEGDPGEDPSNYTYAHAVRADQLLEEHYRATGTRLSTGEMQNLADAYLAEAVAASEDSPLPYAQFAFGRAEPISGDGKTLVNLYYRRTAYALRFDLGNRRDDTYIEMNGRKYGGDEYNFTAKVGQRLEGLWPTQVTHPSRTWYGWEIAGREIYIAPETLTGDLVTGNGTRTVWAAPLWQEGAGDLEHVFYFSALPEETQNIDLESVSDYETLDYAQGAPRVVRHEGQLFLRVDALTLHEKALDEAGEEARLSAWIGDGAEEATRLRRVRESGDGERVRVDHLVYRQRVELTLHPMHHGVMAGGEESLSLLRGERLPQALPRPEPVEGYAFAGWYLDPDFREALPVDYAMPAVPTTLYARYEGTMFQVRFWDAQGRKTTLEEGLSNPQAVVLGEAAILPGLYEKGALAEGYGVFLGWFFDNGGVMVEFTDRIRVYHDYEVYAQWEPVQYTVRYYEDGDARRSGKEPYATRVVTSGVRNTIARSLQYPPETPPARPGQRFLGWYLQPDGSGSRFTAGTPVLSDLDVYGVWEEITYQVAYRIEGIDADYAEQTAVYGKRVKVADAPEWGGYAFGGWRAENTDDPQITGDTFLMPDHDVVLRAQMRKRYPVRVEWNYTGAPAENRPQAARVSLLRGEETFAAETLDAVEGVYTFQVPYEELSGHEADFSLRAQELPGYQALRGQEGETTVFTYVYQPGALTLSLSGTLALRGDTGAPGEYFVFELEAQGGEDPMPAGGRGGSVTATLGADGTFDFGDIRFDQPGVFTYAVCQREGENPAYAYDASVYLVSVLVTDQQGTLVPSITYQRTEGKEVSHEAELAFVNQYRTPREDLEIRVTWDDGNDERRVRRGFVELQLYRAPEGGEEELVGGPARVTGGVAENTWMYAYERMPSHDEAGAAYAYRVAVVGQDPNYTAAIEGLQVFQTYTPLTVTITKQWNILGTGFHKPVEGCYVELYRADDPQHPVGSYMIQGSEEEDTWTLAVPGLLGYRIDGTPIEYRAREPEVAFGTTKEEAGLVITNTYPEDEEIPVHVTFEGEGLPETLIPTQVTLELIRDGASPSYLAAEVSGAAGWRHTFRVPRVHALQSAFTIQQAPTPYFTQEYAREADGSWTVRNVFQNPAVEVSGTVSFQGTPQGETPPAVKVNLWRGDDPRTPYRTQTVQGGETGFRFMDLPEYAPDGERYPYTVTQDVAPGYTLETPAPDAFRNTYAPRWAYAEILAEKIVEGGGAPQAEFAFRLTAADAGTPMPENSHGEQRDLLAKAGAFSMGTIAYAAPGIYAYTLEELGPLPEGFTGEPGKIRLLVEVTEGSAGLSAQVVAESPLRFACAYTPLLRDVTLRAEWRDDEDTQGVRPESLRVQLTRRVEQGAPEDVPEGLATLSEDMGWTHTFAGMPVYDGQGRAYAYSLRPLYGVGSYYTYEVRDLVLDATLKTLDVRGEVLWQGSAQMPRPEQGVLVSLYRVGEEAAVAARWVTGPMDEDRWPFAFEGMLQTDAFGQEAQYYVEQAPISGFETRILETQIINEAQEVLPLRVRAQWGGQSVNSPWLPEEIRVHLYQNEDEEPRETLTLRGPEWEGLFETPFMGDPESLRVEQEPLEHFTTQVLRASDALFVLENRFIPERMNLSGSQRWLGLPEGAETPAVILDLYREGTSAPIRSLALLSGEDAYRFEGLPRTAGDGEMVAYRVMARPVAGFETETVEGEVQHTYAPQGARLTLVGRSDTQGGAPEETIAYTLRAADEGHPMPEGSQGAEKRIESGDGVLDFGEIAFSHPGYYYYHITQRTGARRDVDYDASDIQLTVTVTADPAQEGGLVATAAYSVLGAPMEGLRFVNIYHAPQADGVARVHWEDLEDAWGLRPERLSLRLTRALEGGEPQDVPGDEGELFLDATSDWRRVLSGLPAQDASGVAYVYGLRLNQELPAYEEIQTEQGLTLRLRTREITGEVAWEILGGGFTPPEEGVEILLLREGQEEPVARQWVTGGDQPVWPFRFAGVPARDAWGIETSYRVEQAGTPLGCDVRVSGTRVVNRYAADPRVVAVVRWVFADAPEAARPGQIRVSLLRAGEDEAYARATVDAQGDWTHVFEMPLSDYIGQDFTLQVETPEGYQVAYRPGDAGEWTAELTYTGEALTVGGQIHWVGIPEGLARPSVRVDLWREGENQGPLRSLLVGPEQETYAFTDLPRADGEGRAYAYRVTQHAPADYTVIPKDFDFMNTYAPTSVSVRMLAEWALQGTPAATEAFGFELSALEPASPLPEDAREGRKVLWTQPGAVDFGEIRYTSPGVYRYQIRALPTEQKGFRVDEAVFEVWVTVIHDGGLRASQRVQRDGNLATGVSFTHAYAAPSVDYPVRALWRDQEDAMGQRPGQVSVRLVRTDAFGGQVEISDLEGGSALLSPENDWSTAFTGLAAQDGQGAPYAYALRVEAAPAGYEWTLEDGTLTFSLLPAQVRGSQSALPAPLAPDVVPVVAPDEILWYVLTLENDTARQVQGLRVMDILPAGVTVAPEDCVPPADLAFTGEDGVTTLMWNLPELPAGGAEPGRTQIRIPAYVTALAGEEASRLMENRAYFYLAQSAEEPFPWQAETPDDPAAYTAMDSVSHQLVSLTQTAQPRGGDEDTPAYLREGQAVAYKIQLHVAAPAMGITVSETLPETLSLVQGSLEAEFSGQAIAPYYEASQRRVVFPELSVPDGGAILRFEAAAEKFPEVDRMEDRYLLPILMAAEADFADAPLWRAQSGQVAHTLMRRQVSLSLSAFLLSERGESEADSGLAYAPVAVEPGQAVAYRLTVRGAGYLPEGPVRLESRLEAGVTFLPESLQVDPPEAAQRVRLTQSPKAENEYLAVWTLDGLERDETVSIRFQVLAPKTVDDPETPEVETRRSWSHQARVVDEGLRQLTWQHRPEASVYTDPEETAFDARPTYHVVNAPALEVRTSGAPESPLYGGSVLVMEAGEVLTYTIDVANTGYAAAQNVRVMDILPEGTEYVSGSATGNAQMVSFREEGRWVLLWQIPSLAAADAQTGGVNGREKLQFQARVLTPDAARSLTDQVYYRLATAEDGAFPPRELPDPAGYTGAQGTTRHQVYTFRVEDSAGGGETEKTARRVLPGDAITYTLVLSAAEAIGSVQVSDQIPEGMSLATGSIHIETPGGERIAVPDEALDTNSRQLRFPTLDVAAGENRFVFTLVVERPPEGRKDLAYQNRAQVLLDRGDGTPLRAQGQDLYYRVHMGYTTLTQKSRLYDDGVPRVSDQGTPDAPASAQRGQEIGYEFTVTRSASEENRSGEIVVTDVLPAGMSVIPDSLRGTYNGYVGQMVSMRESPVEQPDGTVRRAVEWVISDMMDGESASLSFRALLPATIDDPETPETETKRVVINQATLVDKDQEAMVYEAATAEKGLGAPLYPRQENPVSNVAYHQIRAPSFQVELSADRTAEAPVRPGEILTYEITLTNRGEEMAQTLLVRDPIPAGTRYVTGSSKSSKSSTIIGAAVRQGRTYLTWVVQKLGAGESITLSFQVQVPEDAAEALTLTNVAQFTELVEGVASDVLMEEEGFQDSNTLSHSR